MKQRAQLLRKTWKMTNLQGKVTSKGRPVVLSDEFTSSQPHLPPASGPPKFTNLLEKQSDPTGTNCIRNDELYFMATV